MRTTTTATNDRNHQLRGPTESSNNTGRKHVRTILLLMLVAVSGCTSASTRLAIRHWEDSEQYKQLAFNNAYRIANEQMVLNLTQFIRLNANDTDKLIEATKATWRAKLQLEECRAQYDKARSYGRLTVGQYLYDQQGALNVLIESYGGDLHKAAEAAVTAKETTGLGLKDLVPKVDSTSPPSNGEGEFDNQLNNLKGK